MEPKIEGFAPKGQGSVNTALYRARPCSSSLSPGVAYAQHMIKFKLSRAYRFVLQRPVWKVFNQNAKAQCGGGEGPARFLNMHPPGYVWCSHCRGPGPRIQPQPRPTLHNTPPFRSLRFSAHKIDYNTNSNSTHAINRLSDGPFSRRGAKESLRKATGTAY